MCGIGMVVKMIAELNLSSHLRGSFSSQTRQAGDQYRWTTSNGFCRNEAPSRMVRLHKVVPTTRTKFTMIGYPVRQIVADTRAVYRGTHVYLSMRLFRYFYHTITQWLMLLCCHNRSELQSRVDTTDRSHGLFHRKI
jgi:hypothetical protein